jgi:hypothetical protein
VLRSARALAHLAAHAAWHLRLPSVQILIDVPRTCSSSALFQHPTVQRCLERILYIWALRHPASGYVQVRARAHTHARTRTRAHGLARGRGAQGRAADCQAALPAHRIPPARTPHLPRGVRLRARA